MPINVIRQTDMKDHPRDSNRLTFFCFPAQVNLYTPGIGYQVFGNLVSVTLGLTPFVYRYGCCSFSLGVDQRYRNQRLVPARNLEKQTLRVYLPAGWLSTATWIS